MPDDTKYNAILTRGSTYFLKKKRFDRGVPVAVTEDEREYLEETAFDVVTMENDGDSVERPKFRFEDLVADNGGEADDQSQTRSRQRGRTAA